MKIGAWAAVLLSFVLLAGCSGLDNRAGTAAPSTVPAPYMTTTPTLELTDRTTKPGTRLKFGELAVVPFFSPYAKGLVGITATVDSAPALDADIDKLRLDDADKDKLRGKTFYFVRVKMVNVDGVDFNILMAPALTAYTRGGLPAGAFLGVSTPQVTGCDDAHFALDEFRKPGAVYEECQLFFGTPESPVTAVWYGKAPYEDKKTRAVIWQQ